MIFRRFCFEQILMFASLFFFLSAQANVPTRLKDLVEIRGVRSNPLMGFGLVVGLAGTGDSKASLVTNKAAAQLITQLGPEVKPEDVLTKNIAAVLVSADLPPFARIGDKLDVRLSSIGDATSLEGGSLMVTPLNGANGHIYAVAQGSVSLGWGMAGQQGGGVVKTSAPKTVALSNGASVEKEFETSFLHKGHLELSLKQADFTTATRVVTAINETFHEFLAEPVNGGLIQVKIPSQAIGNASFPIVAFVSTLEQIFVEPDTRAWVIVNERTGTIIAGHGVRIEEVAISHGNLEITVGKDDDKARVGALARSTTVGELVRALNAFGAGPRDLVAILQALSASKSLKADLKLM